MASSLKKLIKSATPRPLIEWAKRQKHAGRLKAARAALQTASASPEWLETSQLASLMAEYPVAKAWEGHPATPQPDHERAAIILAELGSAKEVLEVGSGPGFVSWAVALAGRNVTALDLTDPLAPEAAAVGVKGLNGDACHLPFADNSFDGLWSFNSYEHIHTPPHALAEAWRVVRPGGRVHINFAPLYNAPLGLHAHYEVGVPFCQHLWTEEQLKTVVKSEGFWYLNYWPLAKYRQMWQDFAPRLRPIRYTEEHDYNGLELIARFPSCFAKRSRDLDEFTVSKFVVTLEVVK
jgi:SAM-dependent methyltransferase